MINRTQIFVDSCDPEQVNQAKEILGSVAGVTTNPSLLVKNPQVEKYLNSTKRFTYGEAVDLYKQQIQAIGKISTGPVSIQVICNQDTTTENLLQQARDYQTWIPNAVVKFPIITSGLKAAEIFCQEGSVNLTLNFSQEQAAAVYQATKNARYQVFISPFIGRLDDIGEDGMSLVKNILQMYPQNAPVKIIAASIRNLDHILYSIKLNTPILSAPLQQILEWKNQYNLSVPANYLYKSELKNIPYQNLNLTQNWQDYNIAHPLTTKGVAKFWEDWSLLVEN